MASSRRDFLRMVPAVSLPVSWTAFVQALHSAPIGDTRTDESFWALVKRQFPLRDGLIYLNAANVCPASRPVMDRHLEFLRDFHADPSFQNREKYQALEERVRSKLAVLLNVGADEIAMPRNTSEGNNLIVNGLDLKAGDEVVITDHNHPSNNDSWKVSARRRGFTIRSVPVPVPPESADQLVSSIQHAITPRTRVVSFTHATNTTGILYPARAIAEVAHKQNIWVHVDGAQTFGALVLDLKRLGCDSYAGSTHKWAMGPLEAGVLYVRKERIAELWPSVVSAHWSDNIASARRFEVFGQRDDPRLVAMEAAVDFINLVGQANIERRMRALTLFVKERLKGIGAVRLKTNMQPELSAGVVKFDIASVPLQRAYQALWSKYRIACAVTPAGDAAGIRFCPYIYNSFEELETALQGVASVSA